jgi:transposase-like protein
MQIGLKLITSNPWATLAAGLASIAAAYFINRVLKRWIQFYRNRRQQSEVGSAKEEARSDAEAAQAESDRLREIDGR